MEMVKYALVFSGQGSERAGMFAQLSKETDKLENIIALLKERLDLDISNVITSKDPAVIAKNNQILLYIFHQVLSGLAAETLGYPPALCMGHSFGQFSALANSGALSFSCMAAFIGERSRIINLPEIAVEASYQSIFGLTLNAFSDLLQAEGLTGQVELALHNQKEQIVAAVTASGSAKLSALGARYNFMLKDVNVSRPYHTSFMEKFNQKLLPYIERLDFADPAYPVFVNNSRQALAQAGLLYEETKIQMVKPVYWYDSVKSVADMVDAFVIIDPGETQLKIIQRITNKKIYNITSFAALRCIKKGL